MHRLLLALAVFLLAAAPPAPGVPTVAPSSAPAVPPARTVGALVYDGIPEIPADVLSRAATWSNVRSASFAGWHPTDGTMLISTRFGETSQIHRVATPGGAREQLTFLPEPVGAAAWDEADPSGMYLAVDRGGGEFYQFHWLDRRTGGLTLLTDGTSRNVGPAVWERGGRIAFTSTARNKKDLDLYLLDRHDPSTRRLAKELVGDWTVVDWSPQGDRLLLENSHSVARSELHVFDIATGALTEIDGGKGPISREGGKFTADGAEVWFTSDEGGEFKQLVRVSLASGARTVVTPGITWDVVGSTLSRDGKWASWIVNEGGRSAVYLGSVAKPASARKLELPQGVVHGVSFNPTSTQLALTMTTARTAGDVYTVKVGSKPAAPVQWTFSETGGLDTGLFRDPELVTVTAKDGTKIPSWYYRPAGPGPFPVIIAIHGGPEGQSMAGFNASVQYWMNELGAAVLLPNVRGSTGYGKTFTTLDNGMKRMDSVRDIGFVLDWIGTRSELDSRRVAVSGGSYGGYMVLATMVEFGDRIACGTDMVGISDFVTFLENTEAYRRDLRRAEYGDERIPEMRAFLDSIAPLRQAGRIARPLLVGQGKNDPRVPWTEAEQIVREVRAQGGTAWYFLANDEGHGLKRRANREAWTATTTLFFEQCFGTSK